MKKLQSELSCDDHVTCILQFAAHKLIEDTKTWEEKENAMVAAAKRMARLMMQMSQFAKWVGVGWG